MIATLTLLTSFSAVLLTALVHYRSKYWNYHTISEKAEEEVIATKGKYARFKEDIQLKFLESKANLKKSYEAKLKEAIDKKSEEFEKKYELLSKDLELEYNNACEEVKNELFEQLQKVDSAVQSHVESAAMKNILTFSCSCSKDLIPCAIDFTKENTFLCPKCGSKYKVAINANPILVGRAISDEQFADLLEKRLNEDKREY